MVSQTGLGVLQVVTAVAQGMTERNNKKTLIDSIVESANHDATEEELNGIRTSLQRNYSSSDLKTLSTYITDVNNTVNFSKDKGTGFKIPGSSWFISTQSASTQRPSDSLLIAQAYADSMAKANQLVVNTDMTMTKAIRTVYQGSDFITRTRWREAVYGTGQQGKLDSIKYDLMRNTFQYIKPVKGVSSLNPMSDPMVISEVGYNALVELGFGVGTNKFDKIEDIKSKYSYAEMLKILKEDPKSPVVNEFYSRLAQAAEATSKQPEDRTQAENKAVQMVEDADNDGLKEVFDDALSSLYETSQPPSDMPEIRSLNDSIRIISPGLNDLIDMYHEDESGNTLTTETKLRLISEEILSKTVPIQNVLLSKPNLRQSYLDYIYSSLKQTYDERRRAESLTGILENQFE